MKTLKKMSRGQVLVLVAVSLIMLMALTALAIDVGIAYSIKAKLNSAVDGAAIAAGRGVKQGATISERKYNGQEAAKRYFAANFPANYMGSVLVTGTPGIEIGDPENGVWKIQVTGDARAPLFFGRAVGWSNLTVKALAETTSRDLDMILVLDTSGSMDAVEPTDPNHSRAIDLLGPAAWNFINKFSEKPGGDRIGVVLFASGAVVSVQIDKSTQRGFDKAAIRNLLCTSSNFDDPCQNNLPASGSTASGEALRLAMKELNLVPSGNRSSLRTIVFFSDGAPNDVAVRLGSGVNAVDRTLYSETPETEYLLCNDPDGKRNNRPDRTWSVEQRNHFREYNGCNIQHLPSQDWTNEVNLESYNGRRALDHEGSSHIIINNKCNVNRAARNMVENVANSARSGFGTDAIMIYTLGLGLRLKTIEICPGGGYSCWSVECGYGNEEWGENILKRVANTADSDTHNSSQPTGLYVFAQNATQLDAAFQTIANQILRLSK